IVHIVNLVSRDKRPADVLARIGGEEFAMLLPNASTDDALCAAERIRSAAASNPLISPPNVVKGTLSIGVATMSKLTEDFAALMRLADQALYEAKNCGRNCVRSYQIGSAGAGTTDLSATA